MTDILYSGGDARIVANVVRLNSKDSSSLRITTDTGFSMNGLKTSYEPMTISRLLYSSESSKVFSNDGAAGVITLTLPSVSEDGFLFKFVRVTAFAFRILPQVDSKIKYSGGSMTDGEYLELASDGAKLHLISDGNGDWISTYEFGTLTEQTP